MKKVQSWTLGMGGLAIAGMCYFNPSRSLKDRWQREYEQAMDAVSVCFDIPDSAKSYQFSMFDIDDFARDKRLEEYMPLFYDVANSLCRYPHEIRQVYIDMNLQHDRHHADYQVTIERNDGTVDETLTQSSRDVHTTRAYNNATDFAEQAQIAYQKRLHKTDSLPPKTLKERISETLYFYMKQKP